MLSEDICQIVGKCAIYLNVEELFKNFWKEYGGIISKIWSVLLCPQIYPWTW